MVFFYPGSVGITRLFPSIYCWDLIELLEVNLTKVWGLFYDWVLPELSSQTCPHSVTTVHQLHFRFSYIGTGSHGGVSHGFLLQKVVTLNSLAYPVWGECIVLWTLFSEESKKNLWIFQFAQLWFIVRLVTSLLSSLHAKWETRSLEVSLFQDESDAYKGFDLISFYT